MATAIPAKRAARRWDSHPRVARRAKPKAAVLEDAEAHLLLPEKEYRQLLWRDFAKFVKTHGGYVVSPPDHGTVRCQVRLADGDSQLEIAMRSLPKYRVTKLMSTATRLSHGTFQQMSELEITLWRGS
jgi:hypothetical protein